MTVRAASALFVLSFVSSYRVHGFLPPGSGSGSGNCCGSPSEGVVPASSLFFGQTAHGTLHEAFGGSGLFKITPLK
jgi:hypothetical protein